MKYDKVEDTRYFGDNDILTKLSTFIHPYDELQNICQSPYDAVSFKKN